MGELTLDEIAARYSAAWGSHHAARVAGCYAPAGSLSINGVQAAGRARIGDSVQAFMTAYPDLQVSFDRLEHQGERVWFHWTFTGHNSGPGGTGRFVRISGYEDWRLGADGLIADSLGYYDTRDWDRQVSGA